MFITEIQDSRYLLQAWNIPCAIEGLDHCELNYWIWFFHLFFVVHAVSADDNYWKLDASWKLFVILFPDGLIMAQIGDS